MTHKQAQPTACLHLAMASIPIYADAQILSARTWHRWRTYLRPDVKHPHLEPFTEWEAAVIVQSQKEMGNNWLGEQHERYYALHAQSKLQQ